jgi:type IV fimbrial biogenesis protein FimT
MDLGFTIIELMIVTVVLAILLGLAVPNMRTLILNNRLTTQANNLLADLQFARTESVKRSVPINVSSVSGGVDWGTQGWRVWMDNDNDGAFDAGEELRQTNQLTGNNSLVATLASIQYRPSGAANTDLSARLCHAEAKVDKQIGVSASGRAEVVSTTHAAPPACP